jgi:surface protein
MANSNGWGDGAANNTIGWGQGAINAIGWGSVYAVSSAGLTDIIGTTATPPVNTVAPVISGSTTVGSVLTTTDGTWSGSPTSFAYQWYRGLVQIFGQTLSTYTLVSADLSQNITCQVTATNAVGSTTATSNIIIATSAPFAFTANTNNTSVGSSTATQFKLPLTTSSGLNIVVSWGDATTSTITNHLDAAVTHTYASAGTYSISITGTLPGLQFNNTGDRLKILNVSSWGILNITTNSVFYGCTNLISNATDAPTITTTDLSSTFRSCINFNNNIGSWNVSAVTNMTFMFFTASAFNNGGSSSIGSWNTIAVTNMTGVFVSAVIFNQNIGSWNTVAVTTMSSMFQGAIAFNQPLSFNTVAVTSMSSMFAAATAFNQPLSFNTALVTNMSSMFNGATAFDQNLGALNVANVTNFASFMLGKTPATFSTTNLDAIYNGWVTVQSSRVISFGTAKYSAAGTAGRNYLTGTKLWTITDGGL